MTARLRRPAAVGVLIGIVMLLGWWQLLWQPQGAALASAHKQVQQESTNLYSVEQNLGHLRHLQNISTQLASLDQRLSAAAPPSDELDQFLLELNSLVQSSGVTVGSISPSQPAVTPGGLSTIAVRLSVQGDYFAVQRFLDTIRAASRLIVVDSLTESPAKLAGTTSAGGVTLGLSIHLLTGLTAPSSGVHQAVAPAPLPTTPAPTTTTAAPTGIISGPVTKARNAVNGANANTAQISTRSTALGGP